MFKDGLLRGRRILVTGGGTGLGKGMAEKFLALGAEVFICWPPQIGVRGDRCRTDGKHGGKVDELRHRHPRCGSSRRYGGRHLRHPAR